jgi:hypothetical protein
MKTSRHLRRTVAAMAVALGAVATLPAITASAAPATTARSLSAHSVMASRLEATQSLYDYGPWYVENSPGYWFSSPNPNHHTSSALPNGTAVTLNCYYWGAPAGPYGNTLWYEAQTDAQFPIEGLINDHYLNTPGTAANPRAQTPHCPFGAGTGMGLAYRVKFTAENSPGAWGNSPTAARDVSGIRVNNGDTIGLTCYWYGNPAGPYGNTLWYLGEDITNDTYGWINDHYLNTPGTAANPQPQTVSCGL